MFSSSLPVSVGGLLLGGSGQIIRASSLQAVLSSKSGCSGGDGTVWPPFSLFNQAKDTNWPGRFRRPSEEISETLRPCHGSILRSLSLSIVHLLFSEAACQPAESSSDSLFKLDSDTNYPVELSQTGNAHKRPSAALSHHLWLLSHFLSASLWISLSLCPPLLCLSPSLCPSVCRKDVVNVIITCI